MEDERLTSELLRMEKSNTKRWFVAFLVVLSMLFLSNMAWLYAWNLPSEDTTITQENDDGFNNYIGNNGDIDNGEADDKNNQERQETKESKTKEQKAAR